MKKNDNLRIRHNCLNCKHCTSELTCDKDGSEIILFPVTQELTCCELSEMAKRDRRTIAD